MIPDGQTFTASKSTAIGPSSSNGWTRTSSVRSKASAWRAEVISASSPLEHLLAMILQELRMRPLISTCGHEQASLRIYEP